MSVLKGADLRYQIRKFPGDTRFGVLDTATNVWHGPLWTEWQKCLPLADELSERNNVSEKNTIEQLMLEMAATAKERREQYGDNWRVVGETLHAMYGGAEVTIDSPEAWNRMVAVVQIVNKLCRLAASQNTHVDSAHDIGPYAAMLELLVKEKADGQATAA